jgi:hypothetical protein
MRVRTGAAVVVVTTAAMLAGGTGTAAAAPKSTGPYSPYAVGLPSQNGNGVGNAYGRPCAGCVGNADAHNPPGQLPGGIDPNLGYECDGNAGVGATNPAHSGCASGGGGGPHPT